MTDDLQNVCIECARVRGSKIPDGHLPTFWMAECDFCGKWRSVTAPRDFVPRPKR